MFVYVGCYTTPDRQGHGAGIAVYRTEPRSGDWAQVQLLTGAANPASLALDHAGRRLYCVHGGNHHRKVSAWAIDWRTGRLTYLNSEAAGGRNPVHLAVHPTDRLLTVASYADGTVAALPINADGTLAPPADVIAHAGEPGPNAVEQDGPHPHHCPFDPAGRFLVVPDKGLDRIFVYRVDVARRRLVANAPPFVAARRGAGPRHAAFHPRLPYAYVLNELDSTVAVYAYDAERGVLEPRHVIATLPPAHADDSTGAEIAAAPSGRFLYASNRGHDSIAIFAIDQATGALTSIGWEPTQGRTPRFFALDPSGTLLYVANQGSDTIVTFRADREAGTLTPTGQVVRTGSPACIVFAEER